MDQLKLIVAQFRDLFLKMTGAQQLSIVAFGLTVLIALGMFASSAMQPPQQQVLFWNLGHSDAAAITEKLDSLGVGHELKGGRLSVDAAQNVDYLYMELSQDGILPEDMSFDFKKMIDEDGFTLTKDERSTRYDIALATELAKQLKGISDIVEAKVNLTKEEPSPLLKSHVPRTASVQVKLRGNRVLDKNEVKGIVTLVANGVKGLRPENVTIIDGRGRPYSLESNGGPADKLEMTWKAERHYARKIETMLLEFIPTARATVSLSLNLNKRRREVKDYRHSDLNKEGSSVLTNNMTEKKDTSSKEGSQGVVGAGTNSQADIREGDGGNQMKANESMKKENFDNSVVQEFVTFDGLVLTVTGVSVVVANKKLNPLFDDGADPSETNLPYEDADWLGAGSGNVQQGASLQELVASAIGLNSAELVKITQQAMSMPTFSSKPTFWDGIKSKFDGYLFLMILLSLVGAFALVSMIRKAQPEEEILEMPDFESENENELPPLKEPELEAEVKQVESRVKEIVDENPMKAVSLIRHWLSSE